MVRSPKCSINSFVPPSHLLSSMLRSMHFPRFYRCTYISHSGPVRCSSWAFMRVDTVEKIRFRSLHSASRYPACCLRWYIEIPHNVLDRAAWNFKCMRNALMPSSETSTTDRICYSSLVSLFAYWVRSCGVQTYSWAWIGLKDWDALVFQRVDLRVILQRSSVRVYCNFDIFLDSLRRVGLWQHLLSRSKVENRTCKLANQIDDAYICLSYCFFFNCAAPRNHDRGKYPVL